MEAYIQQNRPERAVESLFLRQRRFPFVSPFIIVYNYGFLQFEHIASRSDGLSTYFFLKKKISYSVVGFVFGFSMSVIFRDLT